MNLQQFLKHDEEVVRSAAEQLINLRKHVETGALNRSEFEELAEDIVDLEKVARLSNRIKNKALVEQALIQLKNGLPGLLSSVLKT